MSGGRRVIPYPKYEEGEKLRQIGGKERYFEIKSRLFDIDERIYYYRIIDQISRSQKGDLMKESEVENWYYTEDDPEFDDDDVEGPSPQSYGI